MNIIVTRRHYRSARVTHLLAACCFVFAAHTAYAQTDCKNRGDLDALYCDENKDLVADPPTDAKRYKNPSTLVFTYTPVEDPAVYENIFKPFTDYLGKCTGKRVVFYQVQSNAAEIEAMRSGRLHVGGFSTGPTNYAVNLAGAVPFAVKGSVKELQGYNLIMIVKKDSPYQKPADLKGKKSRACAALVELRQSRAARIVSGVGLDARSGLQGAVLRQARQFHRRRFHRRL